MNAVPPQSPRLRSFSLGSVEPDLRPGAIFQVKVPHDAINEDLFKQIHKASRIPVKTLGGYFVLYVANEEDLSAAPEHLQTLVDKSDFKSFDLSEFVFVHEKEYADGVTLHVRYPGVVSPSRARSLSVRF